MTNEVHVTSGHTLAKREEARQMRQAMTPAESRLWQKLKSGRLNGLHFRRQQVLLGYIADFYCHPASLVVEADGEVHEDRKDYDAERDLAMRGAGLTVSRFSNDRITNDLPAVILEIWQAAQDAHPSVT
jgi:very-short-patch-repair endonuclease